MSKKIPSKDIQQKIVKLVLSCVKMSDEKMSIRAKEWERSEKANQAWIPTADAKRNAKLSTEEQSFTTITIPYGYAMMMAQHTYLTSVFLGRPTVLQLAGRNATGQDEVLAMESVLEYQVTNGNMLVPLYIFLYDLCLYGVAFIGTYWDVDTVAVTAYTEQQRVVDGISIEGEYDEVEEVLEAVNYEGNKLYNIKPREAIVDPRVGFVKVQEGEFFGRRIQLSMTDIVAGDVYFNTEFIKPTPKLQEGSDYDNPALVETESNWSTSLDSDQTTGFIHGYELYVRLIPSEHGLSSNTKPEIWVFTVVNRNLLISCQPSGWMHGKFPVDVGVQEFDGYTLSSRGTPEIARPLNQTMDWLINSHMFNVEKSLNNEYVFDPSRINAKDFMDPLPGKRIRMRPEGYGTDPKAAVHQLSTHDVTRTHLQDLQLVESLFQRVFGINDQMLGALASGGRKTATEVRSAAGFGLNRLKTLSEWISAQTFNPLTRKLLMNSRQMYTPEMKFKIFQDEGTGKSVREYSLDEIAGEFEFSPVDGTIPIDRTAQTMIYKELLMATASLPQIAGRYDVAAFFAFVAKMAGVKNLKSFEIQVADQAKIMQEAELGNLVTGGVNGDNLRSNGNPAGASPGVEGTPTITGVGPVG